MNPYNHETEPASHQWWEEVKSKEPMDKKIKPRLYSEEELLKAVEYACSAQKAEDYQTAGGLLIKEFNTMVEAEKAIVELLDNLCNSDDNDSKNITIEAINEYLDENK